MQKTLAVAVSLGTIGFCVFVLNFFPQFFGYGGENGVAFADYGFPTTWLSRSIFLQVTDDLNYKTASRFALAPSMSAYVFKEGRIVVLLAALICLLGAFPISGYMPKGRYAVGLGTLFWVGSCLCAILGINYYNTAFVRETIWYAAVFVWYAYFIHGIRVICYAVGRVLRVGIGG